MAEKTREHIESLLDRELKEFRTARDFAIKDLRDKLDTFSDDLGKLLDELERWPDGTGKDNLLSDQFTILGSLYTSAIRKTATASGFFCCKDAYKTFSS